MLVLKRKTNQEIAIGNDTVVKIIAVDGEWVSVGIDAPRNVIVCLAERLQQRMEEALADAKISGPLTLFRRPRAA